MVGGEGLGDGGWGVNKVVVGDLTCFAKSLTRSSFPLLLLLSSRLPYRTLSLTLISVSVCVCILFVYILVYIFICFILLSS